MRASVGPCRLILWFRYKKPLKETWEVIQHIPLQVARLYYINGRKNTFRLLLRDLKSVCLECLSCRPVCRVCHASIWIEKTVKIDSVPALAPLIALYVYTPAGFLLAAWFPPQRNSGTNIRTRCLVLGPQPRPPISHLLHPISALSLVPGVYQAPAPNTANSTRI